MAKLTGKDGVLLVNGTATAHLTSWSCTWNSDLFEDTSFDDHPYKSFNPDASLLSQTIECEGIANDDTSFNAIKSAANSTPPVLDTVELQDGSGTAVEQVAADYQIVTFTEGGTLNGSTTFSLSLQAYTTPVLSVI